MKNELEQREGLLLPVPRRTAILSSANNSREIHWEVVCGYIHCVHLRSSQYCGRPVALMNWRNKDSVMQSLSMCSANLPGGGAFTCLLQLGQEWRGESLGVVVSSRVIMSWQHLGLTAAVGLQI